MNCNRIDILSGAGLQDAFAIELEDLTTSGKARSRANRVGMGLIYRRLT